MASQREQVIEQKNKIVSNLVEDIKKSDALFFTEYSGLTVHQLQDLRSTLRESNATYKVVKNSLTMRAFSDLNIDIPDGMAKGPTALVISTKDCPEIASKLVKFKKANDVVEIKGGILDGQMISAKEVADLAKLPSRDVLIGTFVGTLKSTIDRFVLSLSSPMRGLVYSLDAIKTTKNN